MLEKATSAISISFDFIVMYPQMFPSHDLGGDEWDDLVKVVRKYRNEWEWK